MSSPLWFLAAVAAGGLALFCLVILVLLIVELIAAWFRGKRERECTRIYRETKKEALRSTKHD